MTSVISAFVISAFVISTAGRNLTLMPDILHNSQQSLAIAGHGCSSKDNISKGDSD
jgi:hypothetical protein